MAISKDIGFKIEKMNSQGFGYAQIANTLKLSKGYISNYLNGKVKILPSDNKKSLISNTDTTEELQTIKTQIQEDLYKLKQDVLGFIKDEMPISKTELEQIKKDNLSLKGKLEFIKKVLKELNEEVYFKVVDEISNKKLF